MLALASAASTARASQLIDRDASGVRLAVNARGEALLTYYAAIRLVHLWRGDIILRVNPKDSPGVEAHP